MKRDRRLHGLSEDHHHSLALARRLSRTCGEGRHAEALAEARAAFEGELAPHFAVEEEILLPALRSASYGELADRIQGDHTALRQSLDAAAGEPAQVAAFAQLLMDHVRFEERELFPACEEAVDDATLDAVFARRPKAADRPAGS